MYKEMTGSISESQSNRKTSKNVASLSMQTVVNLILKKDLLNCILFYWDVIGDNIIASLVQSINHRCLDYP